MKQVCLVQGQIEVLEVPPPSCRPNGVLVRTSHSLISTGTEMTVTAGGGDSLVRKALANPELVRKVLDKVSTVGLKQTIDLVRARQTSTIPLGYSAAGDVVEVGTAVRRFKVGDRVACAGAGYANHAEVNFVPGNLVARIPCDVSNATAAFTTLGAIALQGVRRLGPVLGEQVVVVGLGLVGQLTVQLLRLSGCRVFGVDLLRARVDLAVRLGAEDGVSPDERDPLPTVMEWTNGIGADGVIVCASAGDVGVLNRSFDLCRRKARVVLVGDVPIRISRDKIYRKELDFMISCSYGPGRYDPAYEEDGLDYPLAYVRWTEGRNLVEILRLFASGALRVDGLVHSCVPVEKAQEAYAALQSAGRPIAVLLEYEGTREHSIAPAPVPELRLKAGSKPGQIVLGIIGAGVFFKSVHLPNLIRHGGFFIKHVCARTALNMRGLDLGRTPPNIVTDPDVIFRDPEVDGVLIATRHDLHGPLSLAAADAGKHIFVEKPLALTAAECWETLAKVEDAKVLLSVGFNRRFAPLAREARALMAQVREPKTVLYRVNAGPLPADHWLRHPAEGGGRLVGEGVHFFDFVRWIVGAEPVAVQAGALDRGPAAGIDPDNVAVTVSFADGSLGIIVYVSQGSTDLAKERIEIFGGNQAIVIQDFQALEAHGVKRQTSGRSRIVDKGHYEILENFHDALKGIAELGVNARDGYWATWCAEQAENAIRGAQ